MGARWEYTLNGTPVHRRTLYTHNHTKGQFNVANLPDGIFLGGETKPEDLEETYSVTQAQDQTGDLVRGNTTCCAIVTSTAAFQLKMAIKNLTLHSLSVQSVYLTKYL